MNISLSFIRTFFLTLSVLFLTIYTTTNSPQGLTLTTLFLGLVAGFVVGGAILCLDIFMKRYNLRSFNIALLGLLFGYLMGNAIMLFVEPTLGMLKDKISPETIAGVKTFLYLVCIYLGMIITARASEEMYVSIPFIKFKPTSHKKKDVLIDSSILMDSRILDLASSGLLDHQLILPRFILKELYSMAENSDENVKSKARRCLEVYKKLENISSLEIRYADTDFPDVKDPMAKMIKLARLMDANIITADINRIQQSSIEGIRIINIHMLSNALKPLTQAGEHINIKIQRYGKEARQGVGYLDDGTMVVVNGGADHIGDTIKAQVLSVKHTSSGRMIFCNATDENLLSEQDSAQMMAALEETHKNYFAIKEE